MPASKKPKRKKKLTLKQQFEVMRVAMYDSWAALPPEKRTNFLRIKFGIGASAL